MKERLAALLVWTLVGFSAALLALRLLPQPLRVPAQAVLPEGPAAVSLDRLFGRVETVAPTAAPSDSRFKLLGLVAARRAEEQDRDGLALLSIDGGPPRAVRVGQMVDADLKLMKVEAQTVSLGRDGVVRVQLRLEAPPAATQGQLPPVTGMVPTPQVQAPMPTAPPPQEAGPARQGGPEGLPTRRSPQSNSR